MKKIRNLVCIAAAVVTFCTTAITVYAADEGISAQQSDDYVSVDIDGNYDDWDDKPYTKLQYPWDTGNNYHIGSLFRDEDYVYLHIKMSDRSYSQFNGYNYVFTVDGKEFAVCVVSPEGDYIKQGDNNVIVRNQNGYQIIEGANGVVTRQDDTGDEWELKIPLTFFSSDTETIKEITFHSSNIGPQQLVATGTPTFAIAVTVTGLVIAITGYVLYKTNAKKKKVGEETDTLQ